MGRLIKKVNLYIIEVLVQLMDYIISGCLGSTVVALLSFVVLEEMLCSWQIIFFDYSKRARLLNKSAKDTGSFLCLFFIKRFYSLNEESESVLNSSFAEYGFRYRICNGQNKIYKGLWWRFFSVFLKNTTCLLSFLNGYESKTPFAEVAEVGFFCF